MNRIKKTMQVLSAVLAMVALAACQPDAAIDMDEGTITISTLEVQVQQMGSMGETRATGTNSVVKNGFEAGDVVHIAVALTEDDISTPQYYPATFSIGKGWELDRPMVLPQDATKTYVILAFYNGVNTAYASFDECFEAYEAIMLGTTEGGLTTYKDVLSAYGDKEDGSWKNHTGIIALTASGALAIEMKHAHALLSISSIANNLGGGVTGVVANLDNSNNVPLSLSAPYEAIAPEGTTLNSFTVTIDNSTVLNVPVNAPGGTQLEVGKSYTYKLSLNPGSLTALPTDGSIGDAPAWGNAITLGYIPIYNRAELEKIGTDAATLGKSYILMNDIDLTGSDWTPIGTNVSSFTGIFNGNGHTIKGLKISNRGNNQGLFGAIDGNAILYNIHLRDVNVTGGNITGALVGYAIGTGTISGCSSTGKVSGTANVGGLVGYTNGCHITRCWSTAAVSGIGSSIGGLVGSNSGTIVACYTQGSIVSSSTANSNNTYVGGLAGYNIDGTIFGCYAAQATVSATNSGGGDIYIGALVGQNYAGTSPTTIITSCYATNAASSSVPGNSDNKLVGSNKNGATFIGCISPLAFTAGNNEEGGISGITGSGDYAPLIPTDDANKSIKVRTVVVTDGAIEVDENGKLTERTWSATSIWGNLTNPTALAPHIKWDYNGDPN